MKFDINLIGIEFVKFAKYSQFETAFSLIKYKNAIDTVNPTIAYMHHRVVNTDINIGFRCFFGDIGYDSGDIPWIRLRANATIGRVANQCFVSYLSNKCTVLECVLFS